MTHPHHTNAQAQAAHAPPLPPANLYGSPAMTFAVIAALMVVAIAAGRRTKNDDALRRETFEVKSEE